MTHRVPILIVAAALIAGGCGSSGSNDKAASPASTTAAPNAPYGVYVRTVTKQDVARTAAHRNERGLNATNAGPPAGRYRLVIAKGAAQDVIKVIDPTGFAVGMDLTAVPGGLHLTSYVDPGKGAFCGPEIPAPANYSFKATGASLELKPSPRDPCADRDSMLTGTWSKG